MKIDTITLFTFIELNVGKFEFNKLSIAIKKSAIIKSKQTLQSTLQLTNGI